MSDLMLFGVLRMPLDLVNTRLAVAQLVGRAHEAADRIEADADKIDRLETQWTEVSAAANKALALAERWKANHDHQVSRARFLIERGDIPLERVRAYEGMETLRAVLQDILAAGPIKEDEYPLLAARVKAALDGGGV